MSTTNLETKNKINIFTTLKKEKSKYFISFLSS